MDFIAHIRERDKRVQTVKEHLLGTKDLAEVHGEKLGIKHIVGLAGLLHDLGKFSMEFQNYIRLAVENPERAPRRGTVDHSTAGAKLLYERFDPPFWENICLVFQLSHGCPLFRPPSLLV